MASASAGITGLLGRWSAGDEAALDELGSRGYHQQRRELAHYRPCASFDESSLNTTALACEAGLRPVGAARRGLLDRIPILALTSEVRRNVLHDRARARLAIKRGCVASLRPLQRYEERLPR